METMNAIIVDRPGGPEVLQVKIVEKPTPAAGQVLIREMAFGVNRAELDMRAGKWPEIAGIIGIECGGVEEKDTGDRFRTGKKAAAIMGDMERTIDGSYAEFPCPPLSNVIPI